MSETRRIRAGQDVIYSDRSGGRQMGHVASAYANCRDCQRPVVLMTNGDIVDAAGLALHACAAR